MALIKIPIKSEKSFEDRDPRSATSKGVYEGIRGNVERNIVFIYS